MDDAVDGWLKRNVHWAWRLNHLLLDRKTTSEGRRRSDLLSYALIALAVIALILINYP